ncbi:MAG: hypothetical protein A2054_04170 [Deltaproteobacteria bacterium GWA2_55_10]|nr:MAG: hypothetical protein A2054_04170 [Deltaproteobacteria bacterium GWA2_55_10]
MRSHILRIIFLSFPLLLQACDRQYLFERPGEEVKEEKPLWWVLQHKDPYSRNLEYEDKWYSYEAEFRYIRPGEDIFRTPLFAQCPIESARYKVTDKSTGEVVRRETLTQIPCGTCHRR